MEEPGLAEVVGDVLTWWFGIQFWAKGEPKNPTAHYDDLWRQKYSALPHKTITRSKTVTTVNLTCSLRAFSWTCGH
jgi:hypothetical protein